MKHLPVEEPHALLEKYLDGLLEERERHEFEQLIEREPPLRASVELQHMVDDSLHRAMSAPSQEHLRLVFQNALGADETSGSAQSVTAVTDPVHHRFRRTRWLALAASLLLAVCGIWMLWLMGSGRDGGQPDNYFPPPWKPMAEIYQARLEEGFQPDWVCENDQEFRDSFSVVHRQPLLLGELPEGTEALGLGYTNSITPWTILLLARSQEQPVLLFIDRAELDKGEHPIPDPNLHLHRQVVGDLVVYELSPFPDPRVLPHVYIPEG